MSEWLKDAVFYEIYPQSYYDSNNDGIGDLQGIISKLDEVRELGCNALWINPCFDSSFLDGGYDVSDYKKVAPRYGTNDDLKELFEKARPTGIPGSWNQKRMRKTNTPDAMSGQGMPLKESKITRISPA